MHFAEQVALAKYVVWSAIQVDFGRIIFMGELGIYDLATFYPAVYGWTLTNRIG